MILIYDKKWHEIPEQDEPQSGMVYVCLDEQDRLGKEKTWSVSIMGDGTAEGDTVPQGLFWQKDNAVLFAEELDKVLYGANGFMDYTKYGEN